MKLREFLVCFALPFAGAAATAALFVVVHVSTSTTTTVAAPAATKPPCAASVDVVTVWRDDPTPCDLNGQRLDVVGISIATCDDQGGDWIGDGIDICQDVDK